MMELRQIADDCWVSETALKFMGFPLTSRMTVLRLPEGLWLHSPVPLAPIRATLDRLGPVRWRVAPNLMHHLYQGDYQEAYPESLLYAPPGLSTKRPDLRIDGSLTALPPTWEPALASQAIAGNPMLTESVFLHRPSRTLLLTDLAVHIGPWDHWLMRLYGRLNRCYGRLALSYGLKGMFKDRAAARQSIDQVLDWDFDRIIPAHGAIIERNGKDSLRAAFAWLLPHPLR